MRPNQGVGTNLVNWANNGLCIRTFKVIDLVLGLNPIKRKDMMDCVDL